MPCFEDDFRAELADSKEGETLCSRVHCSKKPAVSLRYKCPLWVLATRPVCACDIRLRAIVCNHGEFALFDVHANENPGISPKASSMFLLISPLPPRLPPPSPLPPPLPPAALLVAIVQIFKKSSHVIVLIVIVTVIVMVQVTSAQG